MCGGVGVSKRSTILSLFLPHARWIVCSRAHAPLLVIRFILSASFARRHRPRRTSGYVRKRNHIRKVSQLFSLYRPVIYNFYHHHRETIVRCYKCCSIKVLCEVLLLFFCDRNLPFQLNVTVSFNKKARK